MLKKFDHILWGVVLGLVLPNIVFVIFYLVNYSYISFIQMFEQYHNVGRLSALLSLSLLINLAAFFFLYWKKYQMAPRGVILATLIWGIAIVYFKL